MATTPTPALDAEDRRADAEVLIDELIAAADALGRQREANEHCDYQHDLFEDEEELAKAKKALLKALFG